MTLETAGRYADFVGTYPAGDYFHEAPEVAMREMLEAMEGVPLRFLPDGETGPRVAWVGTTIQRQYENPYLRPTREGDFSDYDSTPQFGVRDPNHPPTPESFGLDYSGPAARSYPIFQRLRREFGRDDVRFQVGMPHSIDSALYTLGNDEGEQFIPTLAVALADQITTVHTLLGDDGVVQLESPATLVATQQPNRESLPRGLSPEAVALTFRELVELSPLGTRFKLHMCLGDMNNKSQTDLPLQDGGAARNQIEEIVDKWPEGRPLDSIHIPIAGGKQPPSTDERVYRGLQGLDTIVRPSTRIVAGMVHESATLDEQLRTRDTLERYIGMPLGIAAACGIARRSWDPETNRAAARNLMERMRALVLAG